MFELIGILLGLAIYNGIILDIHFPLLVYKKLLGCKVGLDDLYEIQPTLAGGFNQLLQYNGDVENDFLQTFEVCVRSALFLSVRSALLLSVRSALFLLHIGFSLAFWLFYNPASEDVKMILTNSIKFRAAMKVN